MNRQFDVIVIGGGIIGLASAYHLSRRGQRVLVLEKKYPGSGSTGRCIGGIRQQFSTPGAIRLMQESVRQFRSMREDFGFSVEYHEGGYLFLAHDPLHLQTFKAILPLQLEFGLKVEMLDAGACLKIAPQLNPEGLLGGVFSPEDGQAYPFKVMEGYIQEIKKQKSQVCFFSEVNEIIVEKETAKGVRTTAGDTFHADVILNASGPWAREVARLAGLELPIEPEEHEAFITDRLPPIFTTMVVDYRADGCYFCQRSNGQVIGCYSPVPNKPGIHTESSLEFLVEMSKRTVRLVPELAKARVIRHWGGCYSMTPDGSPFIDRTKIKGLYVANGMCGHGFMFAPAIGRYVSEIIMDGRYPFDWSEFSMGRDFSRQELMK
ncbi:MAG: FAD-binding oxidoreductase [Candidatus Aminicenantes bacterium]|nr:FAD-binding oxidoreductase [Candidatus Aminicenantes bacterium]